MRGRAKQTSLQDRPSLILQQDLAPSTHSRSRAGLRAFLTAHPAKSAYPDSGRQPTTLNACSPLQVASSVEALGSQARRLFLPAAKGLLTDPKLAADLFNGCSGLGLFEYEGYPLVCEFRLRHRRFLLRNADSSLIRFPHFPWISFSGAGQRHQP